ncbi:MAG: hypothetical protein KDD46_06525 [Bdellovibrionales bacterium]|nr:hypothetical protein [Bdellovibrionales bacterium]
MSKTSLHNGLFFGASHPDPITLRKALLLYDEVHFLDRPSFNIGGTIGTVGEAHPFRHIHDEELNKIDPVKFVFHKPIGGPLKGALEKTVKSDLQNRSFIQAFTQRLKDDPWFADLFVQRESDYPSVRSNKVYKGQEILDRFNLYDWSKVEIDIEKLDEQNDKGPLFFDIDSNEGIEFTMTFLACEASYNLNVSLLATIELNAVPFTDVTPYSDLLRAKYEIVPKEQQISASSQVKIDNIAHSILDEILVDESLGARSILDIAKYRRENEESLAKFRSYLAKVQHSIQSEPWTPQFESEVRKLLDLEVLPMASRVKEDLHRSWEDLFGSLAKRVGSRAWESLVLLILKGISLDKLVTIGAMGAIAEWATPPVVDFITSRRRIKRTNGLAYILPLSSRRR